MESKWFVRYAMKNCADEFTSDGFDTEFKAWKFGDSLKGRRFFLIVRVDDGEEMWE